MILYTENIVKRLLKEHDQLFELEKRFQPVRDLIKEKNYTEASKVCNDIIMNVDPNFLYKYKYFISKMGELEPEEFELWIHNSIPFKHYSYSEYIEYNEQEKQIPQLPAVFAYEQREIIPYTSIDGGKQDGESTD